MGHDCVTRASSGQRPAQNVIAADMKLRQAAMSDADLLLTWRNDLATRSGSHNTDVISLDEHQAWLAASLASADRKLLIAEVDGNPVGTVRADLEAGAWVLSWTVAPSSRGAGVGQNMVRLFAQSIGDPIRAEVQSSNTPSMKIAKAAGMRMVREKDGVLYFVRDALGGK